MENVKAALELKKIVIGGETIEILDKSVADRRFNTKPGYRRNINSNGTKSGPMSNGTSAYGSSHHQKRPSTQQKQATTTPKTGK
jgi:hypothetical protein